MKFSGHHKNTPLIAFPFAKNDSIVHHNGCSLRFMINYWCLLFMSLIYSMEEGVVNDITAMPRVVYKMGVRVLQGGTD